MKMQQFQKFLSDDQRYILSMILSYLTENEGTSLLITNKSWSRRVLPLFQLPPHRYHLLPKSSDNNNHNHHINQKRHLFVVFPVQDTNVLLDRLNTQKLYQRIKLRERNYKSNIDSNNTTNNNNYFRESNSMIVNSSCYPLNLTTDEIAWKEWNDSRHRCDSITCRYWPANMDLLRYRTPCSSFSYDTTAEINNNNYTNSSPSSSPSSLSLPPKVLSGATLLSSYPRSGNTLLRNLLERITTLVTGSDTRPDRTLSKSLALQHNLVGEGITSSLKTPIIKTHYPERKGCLPFDAHRIILLVRNPYDAIDSYWNMCCTNTHTESVVEDIYSLYYDKFEGLVLNEIGVWIRFLKFWLLGDGRKRKTNSNDNNFDGDLVKVDGPPILLIRYEDLLINTKQSIEEVIHFITNNNETRLTAIDTPNNHLVHHNRDHSGSATLLNTEIHPFWLQRIYHGLNLTTPPDLNHLKNNQENDQNVKEHDNCLPKSQSNNQDQVNTDLLGSYTPRTIQTNIVLPSKRQNHSSTSSSPTTTNTAKNSRSWIGKTTRKNRYSSIILQKIHQIANEPSNMITFNYCGTHRTISLLELLGYDMNTQNFPYNHDDDSVLSSTLQEFHELKQMLLRRNCTNNNDDAALVRVNDGSMIRTIFDPYGRLMTDWRRGQTNDDKNPFPTVTKTQSKK